MAVGGMVSCVMVMVPFNRLLEAGIPRQISRVHGVPPQPDFMLVGLSICKNHAVITGNQHNASPKKNVVTNDALP